nr:reverse transcriptase domain-containing protein [Tanacetum cinerariifolium]
MVGVGHTAYTDRFHELARLVPYLVTPKSSKIERYVYGLAPQIRRMVAATEPKTMQKAVQISSALTGEAVRNNSIKKVEKRGNIGEPRKDKNDKDDNKRTRTGNAFATTINPIGRENTGAWPKCTTCNSYHAPLPMFSLVEIMPPRMRTQSVGRTVAESRGRGTGERVGRGGRGKGPRGGCSHKEFLACNSKEYDGKGGVVVLKRWIKKMKSVQDMSVCSIDQKVKYTASSFVGKALTWWNSQIRTLSQEVSVSMS